MSTQVIPIILDLTPDEGGALRAALRDREARLINMLPHLALDDETGRKRIAHERRLLIDIRTKLLA